MENDKITIPEPVTAPAKESLTDMICRMSFAVSMPNFSLPEMKEIKQSGGYLTYGEFNDYPQSLINMFYQSSLHGAIIQRKCDEIVANGLYSDDPKLQAFIDKCNTKGQSFEDIFRKIVLDYLIFGGFSSQFIFTKATNEIAEVYYQDISKLRFNIDADKVKYAKNWQMQRVKTIEYPLYKGEKKGQSIFYYAGTTTREFYPVAEYIGSIAGIEASIEIQNYHLNSIKNGMFPSLFVDLKNGIPTEEEQREIERRFMKKFGGTNQAGKVIFNYSENATDPNVSITPIDQPDSDKRFITLQDSIRDNIFVGHRITNSALFGVQQAGKLGGQSAEYAEGYEIFQKTYVIPQQLIILKVLNKVLAPLISPNAKFAIRPLTPIKNYFQDEILISSMMTTKEIRTKLKDSGWVDSVEVAEGETLRIDEAPITKVDVTDKQLEVPPKSDQPITEDTNI